MRVLTPERREFAINSALGIVWVVLWAAVTLCVIVAVVVGSVVLGRWFGGLG